MYRPVLLVNSVTFAIKGQELLQRRGISCRIVRNENLKALNGCGYALVPSCDAQTAQNILRCGGVQVARVLEAGAAL